MNEQACILILEFLDEEKSDKHWSVEEDEEVVYSRWAYEEIFKLIMDHPFVPAYETIVKFSSEMLECMSTSREEKQQRIFRIAEASCWKLLEYLEEAL